MKDARHLGRRRWSTAIVVLGPGAVGSGGGANVCHHCRLPTAAEPAFQGSSTTRTCPDSRFSLIQAHIFLCSRMNFCFLARVTSLFALRTCSFRYWKVFYCYYSQNEQRKTENVGIFFRIFSWIQGTKPVNQLKFHDSMKNISPLNRKTSNKKSKRFNWFLIWFQTHFLKITQQIFVEQKIN